MIISETKIKEILKRRLNRNPKTSEVKNAYTDQNIINEILIEEIDLLKEEIVKLKK